MKTFILLILPHFCNSLLYRSRYIRNPKLYEDKIKRKESLNQFVNETKSTVLEQRVSKRLRRSTFAQGGVAGFALLCAVLTLTMPSVAEGIVRIGFPVGSEVLVPGAPFQKNNGYLGMWNWEKQGVPPSPKDQTPKEQARLMEQFQTERKRFDVEAKEQGYKDAEDKGIKEKKRILADKAAAKAAKEAAKEAAKVASAEEKDRLVAEAKKPGTVLQPKYYGNIRGIASPQSMYKNK